ncbi:MAG: ArsA-related P-loop ATPase [Acidimicrobiales bacterium]
MDPATFFAASRVVIVAGKGGVGKTTVTAALARAAARQGRRALIVEVEGKSGLANMFGAEDLGYDEITLADADEAAGTADIRARTLTSDEAMLEYLESHGMSRVAKRLVSSGAIDTLATAAPGIKDILVLGKVKALERADEGTFIVLDAPAAGHAITFLRAARGLLDAVRVGPIHNQAVEVMELLTDADRCQVVLVTLPEETPVNELVETAFNLEDQVGVALGPVVVNGLYPARPGLDRDPATAAAQAGVTLREGEAEALAAAADFRRHRVQLQTEQVARLADQLPLPQLRLPFLFGAELGPAEVDLLAATLADQLAALEGVA